MAFRSVLIPLTGAVTSLASVFAGLGVITALFQFGWGGTLFGTGSAAPVSYIIPVVITGVVFGLSTDYQAGRLTPRLPLEDPAEPGPPAPPEPPAKTGADVRPVRGCAGSKPMCFQPGIHHQRRRPVHRRDRRAFLPRRFQAACGMEPGCADAGRRARDPEGFPLAPGGGLCFAAGQEHVSCQVKLQGKKGPTALPVAAGRGIERT